MSINYQDMNEGDHFVISGCSFFPFLCPSERRRQSIKCRHAVLCVCPCVTKRQHLVLLIVSDIHSHKLACTCCSSARLPFKYALWIFCSDYRGFAVVLCQLPHQTCLNGTFLKEEMKCCLIEKLYFSHAAEGCWINLLHFVWVQVYGYI